MFLPSLILGWYYDIEISGRSKSHAIDQFVLFKTDISLSTAQTKSLSEITCK